MKRAHIFIGLLIALAIFGTSFLSEYVCTHTPQNTQAANYGGAFAGIFCVFTAFVGRNIEGFSLVFTTAATVVMAIFTVSLSKSTKKMWRTTRNQLKLASDEFVTTHRPRIVVATFDAKIIADESIEISFICINAGETTAVLKRRIWSFCIGETHHKKGRRGEDIFLPINLVPGERHVFTTLFPIKGDAEILAFSMARLGNGGQKIFFKGSIPYEDKSGIYRETGFCRFYDPDTERWCKVDDPDYEYSY